MDHTSSIQNSSRLLRAVHFEHIRAINPRISCPCASAEIARPGRIDSLVSCCDFRSTEECSHAQRRSNQETSVCQLEACMSFSMGKKIKLYIAPRCGSTLWGRSAESAQNPLDATRGSRHARQHLNGEGVIKSFDSVRRHVQNMFAQSWIGVQ